MGSIECNIWVLRILNPDLPRRLSKRGCIMFRWVVTSSAFRRRRMLAASGSTGAETASRTAVKYVVESTSKHEVEHTCVLTERVFFDTSNRNDSVSTQHAFADFNGDTHG